jgi:hypothetical protein
MLLSQAERRLGLAERLGDDPGQTRRQPGHPSAARLHGCHGASPVQMPSVSGATLPPRSGFISQRLAVIRTTLPRVGEVAKLAHAAIICRRFSNKSPRR